MRTRLWFPMRSASGVPIRILMRSQGTPATSRRATLSLSGNRAAQRLVPQAKDFLMASGKLQTLCYKHDIEAALRTPGFGGFQLLDLHDFPGQGTALVGVLNAFWDSKGYVTPSEYARFSGPVVPLAELKKMIWETRETLEAKLLLSHFGPASLNGLAPVWKLTDGETVIAQGLLPTRDLAAGALHELGSIRVPLDQVKAPARLTLTWGPVANRFPMTGTFLSIHRRRMSSNRRTSLSPIRSMRRSRPLIREPGALDTTGSRDRRRFGTPVDAGVLIDFLEYRVDETGLRPTRSESSAIPNTPLWQTSRLIFTPTGSGGNSRRKRGRSF